MSERNQFGLPVADVHTVEMCVETFHRYRAEYLKRHGKRPEIAEDFTPHEGGINFEKEESK